MTLAQNWTAAYYVTERGEDVVRDEIAAFPVKQRAKVARYISWLEPRGTDLRKTSARGELVEP